jgi:hypothetical protein
MEEVCAFCKRADVPGMHGHHIIPRCKDGKETVSTCGSCGSFIHATWSHNELRDVFNTVERIVSSEPFQKYLKWLLKQQPTAKFKTVRRNGRAKGKYR